MRYSYQTVGPNGKTNGTNFFSLCSMQLGKKYKNWKNHPEFHNTMQHAHEIVFRETGTYRPGLPLRTDFLADSNNASKETKMSRSCYNDTLFDALDADIIDIETVKQQLV
jgi:hypothetical protein